MSDKPRRCVLCRAYDYRPCSYRSHVRMVFSRHFGWSMALLPIALLGLALTPVVLAVVFVVVVPVEFITEGPFRESLHGARLLLGWRPK